MFLNVPGAPCVAGAPCLPGAPAFLQPLQHWPFLHDFSRVYSIPAHEFKACASGYAVLRVAAQKHINLRFGNTNLGGLCRNPGCSFLLGLLPLWSNYPHIRYLSDTTITSPSTETLYLPHTWVLWTLRVRVELVHWTLSASPGTRNREVKRYDFVDLVGSVLRRCTLKLNESGFRHNTSSCQYVL